MSGAKTVHPLVGNQMEAVDPEETVWLRASAGTGKTHVLTSRVMRLLLQPGIDPSQILCLTFTKAGAAEMASRIKATLAEWVRLPETDLFARLEAIGAPSDKDTIAHARTLFARVLDCPGGGLRIDTIHAFSQWLLGAFPHEANLVPGTRPMEDRERAVLARQVLAEVLVAAETEPLGDPQLLAAMEDLSLRMGPDAVEGYLLRCAAAREAFVEKGGLTNETMRARVLQLLGLPSDADEAYVAAFCADDVFDIASLRRCHDTLAAWDSATGREGAEAIETWLRGDPTERADFVDQLYSGLFTKGEGNPIRLANILKRDPEYETYIYRVRDCIAAIRDMRALLALADRLVPALRLGRAFALAWDKAKQREGLIDFDDQIRQAAALLGQSELAGWIRYKLDRQFDHILVDEAQDTNAAQWDIVYALADDYFAGEGQHADRMRTLFVVGDYKQAIFRFQGTSPQNFERARRYFAERMAAAAENARSQRGGPKARELRDLGLGQSFRTTGPVLEFVDKAIAHIGPENFGLSPGEVQHKGKSGTGHVSLWRPVGAIADEESDDESDDEQDWLSKPDRILAENIARQVKEWTDENGEGLHLQKDGGRRAGPGDVMVLVRKRKELAGLIVAQLHYHGVPVAGVDRLRIGDPLAVRDLLAALRFAAQPMDDLNLANLLVSPLGSWSQEDLLEHGYREPVGWDEALPPLWKHLRRSDAPLVAETRERLEALLNKADFDSPQVLLHWLLTGPWQGRRKLVARLGREANDPIDELLNAASAYAATATPSLVGFLNWFDAGEGELKREADNARGLVRVMTVHGAKGLEAPIVILADATGNPDAGAAGPIDLPDPLDPERRAVPLPGLSKEERVGRIADEFDAAKLAEREEHWRLLYVAMTRAEEALFVGGALGVRDRGEAPENSWYARLHELFGTGEELSDPIWNGRLEWGDPLRPGPAVQERTELPFREPLPPWLIRAPKADPKPPRPLSPSAMGDEDAPDPPYPPDAGRDAARRGTVIHKLLERLPEVAADEREDAGRCWLERNAGDLAESEREEMLASALAVIADPQWAALFSPESLAEVPVAATVGEQVVAGTIDRLLVEKERVQVVDFKTSRRPPARIEDVPRPILRQMAAYCAALERVYPARRIDAALLYTETPQLIVLPDHVIEAQKQALVDKQ